MPDEVKNPYPDNSPMHDAWEGTKDVQPVDEPVEPAVEFAEPLEKTPEDIPPEGTPPADKPPVDTPPAEGYKPVYKSMWDRVEKDGVEIPAEFKEGKFKDENEEWDDLVQTIISNVETEQPAFDPFVENYLKVPVENREAYIEAYNNSKAFFNLDADNGLKAYYQSELKPGTQERKWEDKDIDKHLESLSPIQKEKDWNIVKEKAQSQFNEAYNKGSEQQTQDKAVWIENKNKKNLELAKTVSANIDQMKDFGGVTLTDDIKNNAKRNFYTLTQLDPATGKPHILNLLNDNKKLMKMILAATVFDNGGIQEYLATQNEKFAKMILDEKLDVAPKPKSGSIGAPTGGHLPKP